MSATDATTLAAERTQLARVRTVVALVLVSALVGRLALGGAPLVAVPCVAVALLGLTLAFRLGRAPAGAGRAAALSVSVMVLSLVAGLSLL